MKLGVNIDHVATLREVRQDVYPQLLEAAHVALANGGDTITIHLREDRRHIQDTDLFNLRKIVATGKLNLELAALPKMARIALQAQPDYVCLVPEKRQEVTTEGGLAVANNLKRIKAIVKLLQASQIAVSLFIDPDFRQIEAARECGAEYIELHTGDYGEASDPLRPNYYQKLAERKLFDIIESAKFARSLGLKVNAGHGLTYANVVKIAKYPELFHELNIGHNIVARAIFVGLAQAVREMKSLITIPA